MATKYSVTFYQKRDKVISGPTGEYLLELNVNDCGDGFEAAPRTLDWLVLALQDLALASGGS